MTSRPGRILLVATLVIAGWVSALGPGAGSASAANGPGLFTALAPKRVLDTRIGLGAPAAAVASGATVSVQVDGQGGVPASGVAAVVLNVTATAPTARGYVTVYADGAARPSTSNLNFTAGRTVPNLVVAPVGANGRVALYNGSSGSVQLLADVAGYFPAGAPTAPGAFQSVAPTRVLDTRSGNGAAAAAVGAWSTLHLQVTGRGGVPASGVSAVVLNVTVTSPARAGYVTVWRDGAARPTASNLNFVAGQTVPNLVVAPVGSNGMVSLFNGSAGPVQLMADVAGWYRSGRPSAPGAFQPVGPQRLLDTRTGLGAAKAPVAARGVVHLAVTGRGGVPASGVAAVVLNVTVTAPRATGYITAYADGTTRPTTSNLNFVAGQTVPNLVVVRVGSNGRVALFNGSSGTTQLIADVAGYYLSTTPPPPPPPVGSVCTNPYFTTSDTNGGVSDGGYYVHNNLWNVAKYPGTTGTMSVCSYHSWKEVGVANNNTGDGAVKMYPNVHKDYPSGHSLPSITSLTSDFAATPPSAGIFNVAYDLWLNGVPNDEVMIWTENHNQRPAGNVVATGLKLSGYTWDLWATSGNGTLTFAAPADSTSAQPGWPSNRAIRSGTMDIKAMLTYLVGQGRVAAGSTVDQICYGVEIVDTGGRPATWNFTNFSITGH